jgi:hypothetical protein
MVTVQLAIDYCMNAAFSIMERLLSPRMKINYGKTIVAEG